MQIEASNLLIFNPMSCVLLGTMYDALRTPYVSSVCL